MGEWFWHVSIAIAGTLAAGLAAGLAAWLFASYRQFVGMRDELASMGTDLRRIWHVLKCDRRRITAHGEQLGRHELRLDQLEGQQHEQQQAKPCP